jgi:hypothetical protein
MGVGKQLRQAAALIASANSPDGGPVASVLQCEDLDAATGRHREQYSGALHLEKRQMRTMCSLPQRGQIIVVDQDFMWSSTPHGSASVPKGLRSFSES